MLTYEKTQGDRGGGAKKRTKYVLFKSKGPVETGLLYPR